MYLSLQNLSFIKFFVLNCIFVCLTFQSHIGTILTSDQPPIKLYPRFQRRHESLITLSTSQILPASNKIFHNLYPTEYGKYVLLEYLQKNEIILNVQLFCGKHMNGLLGSRARL